MLFNGCVRFHSLPDPAFAWFPVCHHYKAIVNKVLPGSPCSVAFISMAASQEWIIGEKGIFNFNGIAGMLSQNAVTNSHFQQQCMRASLSSAGVIAVFNFCSSDR